jgi:hypothetical protein
MPTVAGPYMFHQLVEEIMGVIAAAGIAADANVLTQLLTSLRSRGVVQQSKINAVSASVAGNALTVGMQPCVMDFRNAALANGTPNTRIIPAALSLTVPSGATLGTAAATAARLALLAIDNAGTVELAIANTEGGLSFDETGLISTTAISNAANSASVVYSAAARALVPYRLVGYVDITEAAAGTWATAPTVVQGDGGGTVLSRAAAKATSADFISSEVLQASAIAISSGLASNVTSITLPVGDWEVSGNTMILPAATTNIIKQWVAVSTTSASISNNYSQGFYPGGAVPGVDPIGQPAPTQRIVVTSGTIVVYLVAAASFTVSTAKAFGKITARRIR